MNIKTWILNNKLASVLIVVLLLITLKSLTGNFLGVRTIGSDMNASYPSLQKSYDSVGSLGAPSAISGITRELGQAIMPPIQDDYTPQPGQPNRIVVEESNMSLLVKNVTDVRNQIVNFAQKAGGYMVSSQVSNPQDAPTASVIIRVPSDRLEDTLTFLRSQAVKVVSENLSGQDVTDQYVDVDKRIALLEKTLAKFETILTNAQEVSDITNLTQQIISIQSQIDSMKGQQEGLTKRAQLAKVTIYLSTDEIALPYAPSETWRPSVIFKLAVRSLVADLRGLATSAIWLGVYAVIWIPVIIAAFLAWRYLARRTK